MEFYSFCIVKIFVERKTHREDWTGEKSVKARFPLKEHLVVPFLRGEYTVDADFQELVTKGKKSQAEVDGMIQLANEVQYAVLTKHLCPGKDMVVYFEDFPAHNFVSHALFLQPHGLSVTRRCTCPHLSRHGVNSHQRG